MRGMGKSIVCIDAEIGIESKKIADLGAIKEDRSVFHSSSFKEFLSFIGDPDFLCGHNIVHHDMVYIKPCLAKPLRAELVDTLYLSPLLFPARPYHRLVKDDKLQVDQLNNPLNDAEKAMALLLDEVAAFFALPTKKKRIYSCLLYSFPEFRGFFDYVGFVPYPCDLEKLIQNEFCGLICSNAELSTMIKDSPVELAYALALIGVSDRHSITPPWLSMNYPKIEGILQALCHTPCRKGCGYCNGKLDVRKRLKQFFGYDRFRTYGGEPLQEKAAQAAVEGKSLLAVFPTGGGKSIAFQLPALIAGEAVHGLTVVLSPLQSLMKDQVDNLAQKGIADAVTLNGLLNPIERAEAIRRVSSGLASILYISPEQLRSATVEKLLLSRNVVRFVIDEAHCFSAWGQDFRVDYLFIGDFIREYQKKKGLNRPIPVSCFTATAKRKVISDICDYFRTKLNLYLDIFATTAERENLRYRVLFKETDEEKYAALRALIQEKNCPTIVYVSRTRRSVELAEKLTRDGFPAKPFNGKMEPDEKIANQEAFIENRIQIIVATSAFGMGVDKKDVKLVVHYDISDSLENYVQEAGRAGRDPELLADCFVLFNNNDLDKHFILLNQTKLSIGEIQQVWKAVKDMTREKPWICCSALEIARQAGWDDSKWEIETRVKTAISALETAGYLRRGRNVPRVYATSILSKNMMEAATKIDQSTLMNDDQKEMAKKIVKSLISSRSIAKGTQGEAESRVDYLADKLGLTKKDVLDVITMLRQEGILADSMDMSAYMFKSDTENRSALTLNRFAKLEEYLLSLLAEGKMDLSLKEINEAALEKGITGSSTKNIRTILYFWNINGIVTKCNKEVLDASESPQWIATSDINRIYDKFFRRIDICRFLVTYFYEIAQPAKESGEAVVEFSLVGLYQKYLEKEENELLKQQIAVRDIEDALLYLSKIGSLKLEGGFLVLYNGMELRRLVRDNKIRYKIDDYRTLDEFYQQKIQQIHIVGEYANLMVKDYDEALRFVHDYFSMESKMFISKYFKGKRSKEITRNITPEKYEELFGALSETQSDIIGDSTSRAIVVAAGPGSGKTRVLVHKLASLLLLEDVKHEQLLTLTFSRAAATEFKKRLMGLIGNAANFVEIKTFHSYCFDLLGKIGSLEGADNVVSEATKMIVNGEVEPGKITKSVLVIDEAQDMDANEFALVKALMDHNDDMRVIAVGDDDQTIFEFRGSDFAYMQKLMDECNAKRYELVENYRSKKEVVALANWFVAGISKRMKTQPIIAVNEGKGTVQIVAHRCEFMQEAVVRQIKETYKKGKACVLTQTNDEASLLYGLLLKNGIRAKLIQSLDGFRLSNLAEVRYFFYCIDQSTQSPIISKNVWEEAKTRLKSSYATSTILGNILNMISDFERMNPNGMYRTDLEEFIKESQFEDFYTDERETVYLSTIHKSKGREFDTVWLYLHRVNLQNDGERRKLYVGITRAKEALYVHCDNGLFDACRIPEVERIEDKTEYEEPKEIVLSLTHRDVVLSYFKGKSNITWKLRSGMKLTCQGEFLFAEVNGRDVQIAKLSRARMAEIEKLAERGYRPAGGVIRFVLAWKGEGDEEVTPILLPDLTFVKEPFPKE